MKRTRLIDRRKELSMTQQEVADKAGIRRNYYGLVETGTRNPSLAYAIKISAAIGLSVEEAFENEIFFAGKCFDTKRLDA